MNATKRARAGLVLGGMAGAVLLRAITARALLAKGRRDVKKLNTGAHEALLASYAKTHLYGDVDRDAFVPGDVGVVQFRLDGLVAGLLVCYDVEFPEAVRAHALAGTELLVVPTGLMDPYGHIGTVLVPARAYESQVFVAYANRTGAEGEFVYCGASCVIAPDGTELARAGRGEELLVADVDPAVLTASRRVNTHLADRRPELYLPENPA